MWDSLQQINIAARVCSNTTERHGERVGRKNEKNNNNRVYSKYTVHSVTRASSILCTHVFWRERLS